MPNFELSDAEANKIAVFFPQKDRRTYPRRLEIDTRHQLKLTREQLALQAKIGAVEKVRSIEAGCCRRRRRWTSSRPSRRTRKSTIRVPRADRARRRARGDLPQSQGSGVPRLLREGLQDRRRGDRGQLLQLPLSLRGCADRPARFLGSRPEPRARAAAAELGGSLGFGSAVDLARHQDAGPGRVSQDFRRTARRSDEGPLGPPNELGFLPESRDAAKSGDVGVEGKVRRGRLLFRSQSVSLAVRIARSRVFHRALPPPARRGGRPASRRFRAGILLLATQRQALKLGPVPGPTGRHR